MGVPYNGMLFILNFIKDGHWFKCLFFIRIGRGVVQLGSVGTAATFRPTVPTPGDYDDGEIGGMMIGRGNRIIG
jgi:hypothetical protein